MLHPFYVPSVIMPEVTRKRGRPRKYDTPEEKAKQDVIAKRARRRLQKLPVPAHGDIRFQIYVPQQIEALPPSLTQKKRLDLTSYLDDTSSGDGLASRIETPSSINTTAARSGLPSRSTEGAVLASPCPRSLGNMAGSYRAIDLGSGDTNHAATDNNECKAADCELHSVNLSNASETECTAHLSSERDGVAASPNVAVEIDPGEPRNDGNVRRQNGGAEDTGR